MRLAIALALAATLASCTQPAGPEVSEAWTRDTVGGTANAAVFMTIASPTDDRLVGASAAVAGKTDLMTMQHADGAMAMTYVEAIELPAGETVSLDPTGLHVWLDGLKQPLAAGETFPLALEFEKAGRREVTVSVLAPAEAAPMAGMEM